MSAQSKAVSCSSAADHQITDGPGAIVISVGGSIALIIGPGKKPSAWQASTIITSRLPLSRRRSRMIEVMSSSIGPSAHISTSLSGSASPVAGTR